jgi:iron complex transport system substrate-binding protein
LCELRRKGYTLRKPLMVAFLVLCAGGSAWFLWHASSPGPSASDGTVTVTDLAGRQVSLHYPINRIVLMRSFFVHELVLVLGDDIQNKLVGWDSSIQTGFRDAYLKYIDRYPALDRVAVLGDSVRDAVSAEAVLALKPDLVILDTDLLDGGVKFVGALEEAGLPLLFVASRDAYNDPQRSLLLLGRVLGREERANDVNEFISAELGRVLGRLDKMEGPEPSIYLETGDGGREYGNTFGYDPQRPTTGWGGVLARLRCRNIAADRVVAMGKIDPEYLIKADPDVIVMTGAHWTGAPDSLRLGYHAGAAEARNLLHAFTARPGWDGLKAVKNGRVYGLHMRFCCHATTFVAAQQLAKWLYPVEFKEVDPEKSLREFHERFLPINYSGTWMIGFEN